MKRIKEKIGQLQIYLDELRQIKPLSVVEYKSNIEKKAACERYVEKIVEAMTDLTFLIIKFKKLRIPEDDSDAFTVLLEKGIISNTLRTKLQLAKGMRNILAHQYAIIDDEVVFMALDELDRDGKLFIKKITQGIGG